MQIDHITEHELMCSFLKRFYHSVWHKQNKLSTLALRVLDSLLRSLVPRIT